MKKLINRYICAMVLLFTFTGYAQWIEGVGGNAPYYGSNTPPGYASPFTFTGTNQLTGVTITTAPSGPNWAAINAQADAEAAARAAAIAINIPKQPVIPPPTGGIIVSAPPKPSAPPPTPKPDPCAEIMKAIADAKYKAMIAKLDNPATLHLPNETGFWRDKDGNFTPMRLDGSRTCLLPDDRSTLQSIDHVHQEPWTVVQDDGSITYEANYIMPSRQDLWDVYYMIVNAKYHNIPLNNIYVGGTNILGNYQIRYIGNPDSLSYDSINKDNMGNDSFDCDYVEAMDKYGNNETGMLYFINTVMGKTDLGLYKIETTGGVKLTSGQNNTVTKTPCP